MDEEKEIQLFWDEKFVHFPEKSLTNFHLSKKDKLFLVNIGLPKLENDSFQFLSSASALKFCSCKSSMHVVIGSFGTNMLGIEVKTRCIHLIDNDCSSRDFLNSNLESLLMFLIWTDRLYYAAFNYGSWTTEDTNIAVDKLVKKLLEIDPKSFEKSDSFWSIIIRDMRLGLV